MFFGMSAWTPRTIPTTCHAEAHRDAAQSVSIELTDLRLHCEELNRVASGENHGGIQIFVETYNNPVLIRLSDRPTQVLALVEDNLDLQFLHAGLDGGNTNLSIALHGMAIPGVDERSGLPHWNVQRRPLGQLTQIEIARMWPRRYRVGHARTQRRKIAVRRRHAQSALEWP